MFRITLATICLMWSLMLVACGSKHVEVENGLEQIQASETNSTFPLGVIVENQELAQAQLPPVPMFEGSFQSEIPIFNFVLREVPPAVIEPAWSWSAINWSEFVTGKGHARTLNSLFDYVSMLDNISRKRNNIVPWQISFSVSKKESRLGADKRINRKNRSKAVGDHGINVAFHKKMKRDAYNPEKSAEFSRDLLIEYGFENDPVGALREYNGGRRSKYKPATLRYAIEVLKDAKKLGYEADIDFGRLYEKQKKHRHHHRRRGHSGHDSGGLAVSKQQRPSNA